jgi:hypothetical protein
MMGRDLTNTTRKTRRHEPAGCLIYALRSGRYRMSVSMGAVAGSAVAAAAVAFGAPFPARRLMTSPPYG